MWQAHSTQGDKIMKFLKNVFSEMKQVTWLSGKELTSLTWTVISSIVALAVIFGAVDGVITFAIQALLSN